MDGPVGAGITRTSAVSDNPLLVATTLALPTATAVTVPVAVTEATDASVEDHATTAEGTTAPASLRTVACSVCVPPGASSTRAGDTLTPAFETFAGDVGGPDSPPHVTSAIDVAVPTAANRSARDSRYLGIMVESK